MDLKQKIGQLKGEVSKGFFMIQKQIIHHRITPSYQVNA